MGQALLYTPNLAVRQIDTVDIAIHEYAPFLRQVKICYTFFIDTLPKRLPNWLKTSFDITSSPQDTP